MYNNNFSNEPIEKQKNGQIGEDLDCEYLENIGNIIVERNHKWGEIDTVSIGE